MNIPFTASKKEFLLAHELSLFLKAISKTNMKKEGKSGKHSLKIHFSDSFMELLSKNINHIFLWRNVTLRNLANIYKGFD